ncbi:ketopantoate reductase family protein [Sphingomicrobium sediminis]|uniref:2-dehydropantoate 2-reductase n=1 Tax=Sphingomicrobium sediminis TaxID=2950949 RepID=A0A9X2ELT5_9SPHN|nr:2-dehydropantoate 2-reductase [Sphingomicrobium sediminis]MCM8557807.1 2-dehydropantoate 2-reductase [Sphingomicrobium sediminis]
MKKPTYIGVIGAGSIGCWLGGRLKAAGHEVAILREEERIKAPHENLVIKEGEEEERVQVPVLSALDPKPDILLVAVKAMFLPDVAPLIAANMSEETLVLPLQNGVPYWFMKDETIVDVDPVGSVRTAIPRDQTIGTVVHAAVSRQGDWINVKKADTLLLGEVDGGTSERVAALTALFRDAGVPSEEDEDIRRAIWYKIWGNLTMNPLSALTRETMDRLLADEQLLVLVRGAMEELREVGAAIGCPIEQSVDDRLDVARTLGVFKTSMLQDLEAGRPLEWKALVAAPRAIAKSKGIDTPFIDSILGLIRLLDRSLA